MAATQEGGSKSRVARIKLEVAIPNGVTKAEAKEWLRFVLHDWPEMASSNPLVRQELEPRFFEVEFDY
jgi:hypothetical protein